MKSLRIAAWFLPEGYSIHKNPPKGIKRKRKPKPQGSGDGKPEKQEA